MPPSDDPDWVRKELKRNLKSRQASAWGSWFPAAGAKPAVVIEKARTAEPVTDLFGEPVAAAAQPGAGARATAPPGHGSPQVIPTQGQPRPASREQRAAELEGLARHAEACRRCALGSGRTQAVFGVGNPDAALMFVGEGPGRDEDLKGEPFVGRAGQKLNSLIEKLGFQRSDVYIANVVKCRPPDNRTPLPEESAACFPYLDRQIELVAPRVIIALGLPAAQTLLGQRRSMAEFRKQQYRRGEAIVVATYHPAYVLRNPSAAWDVWNDVKGVPELLRG